MCVGTDGDSESPPEPKVSNLYGSLVVYEEILWLEVTVDDATCVHEHNTLQYLVGVALGKKAEGVKKEKVLVSCSHTLTSIGSTGFVSMYFLRSICINSKTR